MILEGDRPVRLQGNRRHPLTGAFLCARTVRYLDRVYSPDRITRPLVRERDRLVPVSWERALDLAAARLDAARRTRGPWSVMHYRSAGSVGLAKELGDRFWNLFGGVTELTGDFCLGAGKTALERHMGDYRAHSWEDLAHSRTIVLWGRDPFTSGPHVVPFLRRAVAAGARVVSVNPTDLGHPRIVADRVRVRPGGDRALALALCRSLIEQGLQDEAWIRRHGSGFEAFATALRRLDPERLERAAGIPGAAIDSLAARLSEDAPAAILMGTGLIRHADGVEAAAAVAMIPALLGTVGRPGGGISFSVRRKRGLDASVCRPDPAAANREILSARMPGMLEGLDPPVEVAWIECANPANAFGDSPGAGRALRSIPFVVVADFHRTATTDLADLVLPVTSFLEADDVVASWGQPHLALQRRILPPLGEAREDLAIYQSLAGRLGFGAGMEGTALDWCRRMVSGGAGGDGLFRELMERGFARNPAHEAVPWRDGRFATPSGKFEFLRGIRPPDPPQADPRHPLRLLTPKSAEHHLSQVLPDRRRARYDIRMSPAAMAGAGVAAGQAVRVASSRGAIEAVAAPDPSLDDDVVVLPFSGWAADANDVNALTPPDVAEDGVTFAYYDCRVRVEPVEPGGCEPVD